eukprot:TRINITY_DN14131_c0_g1_i1.p1 TRINITY_DN14131_c0_g1~~TRINITY_DN14131_c0_g1_i1.p1  ORF type:complete len:415 (+),score=94.90 TRINITY_DN14131_c0_g1_i1:49-1293(+)
MDEPVDSFLLPYEWEKEQSNVWSKPIITFQDNGDNDSATFKNMEEEIDLLTDPEIKTIRRNFFRHILIIVDACDESNLNDYKPLRFEFALSLAVKTVEGLLKLSDPFIKLSVWFIGKLGCYELFDFEPIGKDHMKRITYNVHRASFLMDKKKTFQEGGKFSMAKVLLDCCKYFDAKHLDGSLAGLEVLLFLTSTRSNDIEVSNLNLSDVIQRVVGKKVIISIVGLAAEVFLFKKIAANTGGHYVVVQSLENFSIQMDPLILPQPARTGLQGTSQERLGFPQIFIPSDPLEGILLCSLHSDISKHESKHYKVQKQHESLYKCPICATFVCSIPFLCPGCGILLTSAEQLATKASLLSGPPSFQKIDHHQTSDVTCFCCQQSAHVCCGKCDSSYCLECAKIMSHDTVTCVGCMLTR